MQNSSNNGELQSVCESYIDVIVDSGYTLPMKAVNMENKWTLIRTIMLHATLLKNKGVLDQLKSGLSCLGVLDAITTNPSVFESFFVGGKNAPLTAGTILQYINIFYSNIIQYILRNIDMLHIAYYIVNIFKVVSIIAKMTGPLVTWNVQSSFLLF